MSIERFKTGQDILIEAKAEDQAGAGITDATLVLTLRRKSDDQFWTGAVFQVGTSDLTMTEVSETNAPGYFSLTFDTSNGLDEDEYVIEVRDTSGNAKNEFDPLFAYVGGYLDDVEDKLDRALGLLQENMFLDSTTHNTSGAMVSGRIRIFPDNTFVATDGGSGEGEISTYNITAVTEVGFANRVKTYQVKKA